MESPNVETYRAGHEAFNRRDFAAMTRQYAASISWTDHSQGRTFRTPQEFRDDFLAGWAGASPDIKITEPRYIDAGQTVVCTFTVAGTHDGRLGPFPATGKEFALPLCEMWHFDPSGRVDGGDLYYDQVSLLLQLGLMPQPSGAYAASQAERKRHRSGSWETTDVRGSGPARSIEHRRGGHGTA